MNEYSEALEDESDEIIEEAPRRSPITWATYLLLAIYVGVLGWAYALGESVFSPSTAMLMRWGASYGVRTMDGEYWRLLTAIFIQFGISWFAILNLYILWTMRSVESLLGPLHYLAVFLISGIAGNLALATWNPWTFSHGCLPGIMGVAGAMVSFYVCFRHFLPKGAMREGLQGLIFSILMTLGLNAMIGGSLAGVLGGVAGGTLAGFALIRTPGETNGLPRRGLSAMVLIAAMAFCWYGGAENAKKPALAASLRNEVMEELTVGDMEIRYSVDFKKEIAEQLGEEMKALGFTKNPWTVFLRKENGMIALGFLVKEGVWDKPSAVTMFKKIGKELSSSVFQNQPMDIQLYNAQLETKKSIKLDPDLDKDRYF